MNKNYASVIILLLISFCTSNTYTQNHENSFCGTVTSLEDIERFKQLRPQIEKYEKEFYELQSSSSRAVINSIPIKAHIIRRSDGTGGLSVSDLNDAMTNLNNFYANSFMEFFLCDGINYIDSDNYYDFETNDESAMTSTHNVTGLINIYFTDYVESSSSGNSLCGYAYYPGGPDTILMNNSCAMNGSTLPHEVGHFFSLIHTHGPSNSTLTTELVDGSNCDTDGDLICDTPADPQLNSSIVNSSCLYTGTQTDANGDTFTPDPNNIMSYSRKSCRIHFSTQQYARLYATHKAIRNGFSCPSLSVDFVANETQTCNNSLTVNFTDNSIGATSWNWDIDSDGSIDYVTQNPSHTFGEGNHDVTLTISNGTNTITRTFFKYISVGNQQSIPHDQDFESYDSILDSDWSTIDVNGNGYNWLVDFGGTPSNGTGPTVDNTSGTASGKYVYAEASSGTLNDEAHLISPCIDINSSTAIFEFTYHMHGANVGELHIDVETNSGYNLDVIPAIIGEQQANQTDAYSLQQIDLSAYDGQSIKIRFRAIRGASWNGDIAIDDVAVFNNTLSTDSNEFSELNIYPNPVSNTRLNIKNVYFKDLDYEVINLMGQVILKGALDSNSLDVSKLNTGTYFLILKSGNAKAIKKFIKL